VDILSGVSVDWFRALAWISAIISGLLLYFWRPRRPHLAVLGSVIVYMVANIGAGIYVLYHLGDARWNGGAGNRLSAPSLSDAPVVGEFMRPLDEFMNGVVDGVNDFIDFREALPVALEFFAAAGWALFVSLPLALLALIISYAEARRRKAEFTRYKLEVDELRGELDDIKRQLGHPKQG
jgi:hypothetical protein